MRIEDLEGKLVLFKFSEEVRTDLSLFQIYKDEVWAIVSGVESEGVWVVNPAYELGIWWDEQGRLVEPRDQVKETVKANVFIPWRFIKGMMSVEDERFQRVRSDKLPGFQSYK